jgi:hypothetical protein
MVKLILLKSLNIAIFLLALPCVFSAESDRNIKQICVLAAKVNSEGLSFWDSRLQKRFCHQMRESAHSNSMIAAYFAYLKVEMKQECASVW